jgi:hypothetical protein
MIVREIAFEVASGKIVQLSTHDVLAIEDSVVGYSCIVITRSARYIVPLPRNKLLELVQEPG